MVDRQEVAREELGCSSHRRLVRLYDDSSHVLTWNLGTTVDAQELLAYCESCYRSTTTTTGELALKGLVRCAGNGSFGKWAVTDRRCIVGNLTPSAIDHCCQE